MRYIYFDNQKISKLSLGTVQFGLDYGIANKHGKPSQESVNSVIDYLYKSGINCFDTAQEYGNSEEVLGKALNGKNDIFIVSKIKSNLFKESLESSVEKSLINLNRKEIFGLLLHDSELLYDWHNDYTNLIDNLKKSKKIKYFGVSIYSDEDFQRAISNESIQIIQIPFNIFDQRAISESWLQMAKEKNKLIFIRSIFLQGLFFIQPDLLGGNLKQAKSYLLRLNNIASELNMSISELAISFVNSVADDSVLLFGCDTITQAKENIENFNNMVVLDDTKTEYLRKSFSNIPDEIINPTLWRKG